MILKVKYFDIEKYETEWKKMNVIRYQKNVVVEQISVKNIEVLITQVLKISGLKNSFL